MSKKITELRTQIDEVDRAILELISKRTEIASEIGRLKVSTDLAVRNFAREKICIENARRTAAELGLSEKLAEEVQLKLIEASLTSQEQDRLRLTASNESKKGAVIGGCGKMGNWFAHFLESLGFEIDILDPNSIHPSFNQVKSIEELLDHDVIVVAAPLHESNQVLLELARLRPMGLIFDIASLKGPLKEGLAAIATSNMKAVSIHPMFGPSTQLLSGRHVILVDLGNKEANLEVSALFAATMATIVQMNADEHDRNISFLLGLSHAVNLIFAKVLAKSGESVPRLAKLSSTTFDAQLSVATRVAMENPKLYFEIQALNPFGDLSLRMLEEATKELRQLVLSKDQDGFTDYMQSGYDYFQATHKRQDPLHDSD